MNRKLLTYKLFESLDKDKTEAENILTELIDNLSNINDILGQPHMEKINYTKDLLAYKFIWSLGFEIGVENDVSKLLDLSKVVKELIELNATKERMTNFDFKISITNRVILSVYPNIKTNQSYQFVLRQEWREVILNKIDIIRFFRDNDVDVIDISVNDDDADITEQSSVTIRLNKGDVSEEFGHLLKTQIDSNSTIDREVGVHVYGPHISIYPEEEKTYVILE